METLEVISMLELERIGDEISRFASKLFKEKGYVDCGGCYGDKEYLTTFKRDNYDLYERPITIGIKLPYSSYPHERKICGHTRQIKYSSIPEQDRIVKESELMEVCS